MIRETPKGGDGMVEVNRWYTIAEIVEMLSVHEQTVRRWLKTGELRGTLLGRKAGYRIQGSDLQAFLDARAVEVRDVGKLAA